MGAAPKRLRHSASDSTATAGADAAPSDGEMAGEDRAGVLKRARRTVRTYLPRGNTLDERTFQRRHLFLCWVLALHIPGLFAMGVARGYPIPHLLLELTVPATCVVFGRMARNRRLAAFFVTAGNAMLEPDKTWRLALAWERDRLTRPARPPARAQAALLGLQPGRPLRGWQRSTVGAPATRVSTRVTSASPLRGGSVPPARRARPRAGCGR